MPKKLIYILLIVITLNSCDFRPASEYYNKALDIEKKGDLKLAIQLLDKAIAKKENHRPALLNRGTYKSDLGLYDEGNKDYKRILDFDPDNTSALFNIANNFSLLEKPNHAIKYYTKALKTKGALKSFASSDGKAMAFQFNDDYKYFDNDADYYVHDCEIYFERGIEYLAIEEFDMAISDFKKSLLSNNAKKDCYYLIGEAYIGKKDSINACQAFIESAKLGDKDAREMLKEHCIKKEK
ncbi:MULTISPECIES: tetratricopeptide repeat protein [Thalassobellus]|uniref:tetratricopeptide repeat protein n=1 Tax=Thalassobellus TaxID=3400333 RepID=UPI0037B5467E